MKTKAISKPSEIHGSVPTGRKKPKSELDSFSDMAVGPKPEKSSKDLARKTSFPLEMGMQASLQQLLATTLSDPVLFSAHADAALDCLRRTECADQPHFIQSILPAIVESLKPILSDSDIPIVVHGLCELKADKIPHPYPYTSPIPKNEDWGGILSELQDCSKAIQKNRAILREKEMEHDLDRSNLHTTPSDVLGSIAFRLNVHTHSVHAVPVRQDCGI